MKPGKCVTKVCKEGEPLGSECAQTATSDVVLLLLLNSGQQENEHRRSGNGEERQIKIHGQRRDRLEQGSEL